MIRLQKKILTLILLFSVGVTLGACSADGSVVEQDSDVIISVRCRPYHDFPSLYSGEAVIELKKTELADSYVIETENGFLLQEFDEEYEQIFGRKKQKIEGDLPENTETTDIFWHDPVRIINTQVKTNYISSATITARFYKEDHLTGYALIRLTPGDGYNNTDNFERTVYYYDYTIELMKCSEFPKVNGRYQNITEEKLKELLAAEMYKWASPATR